MITERKREGGFLRKVMRNSIALAAAKAVEIAYGLLSMAIVARYLGINDFGEYAFIVAVGALATPLVDMGLRRIVIREIARDTENVPEYLGSTLFLRGTITLFLLLTIAILVSFTRNETLYLIALVMIDKILFSYETIFTGVFNAKENMGYETLITTFKKLMNLFLLLLVVFLNGGIKGIIWGMLLSSVTGASLGYLLYRNNFIIRKLKVSQERCKFFIKEALPLALYAFILVLFYKVDIYFLKYYRSNNEIGLYQAASQFVLMWSVIPTALAASLFPSFSRYAETDRERFISVYSKTLKYLLILGLAIVLTILYLTEEIIYLVYGSNFIEASSAMRILAWTILMVFFNVLLNTILTAVNKQFWNTVAAAACLLLNVCIDAIFIPQYGYISACYATLASFIVLFFITFYSVNKFVVSINLIDLLCKPFICVAVPVLMLVVSRKSGYLFLVPSLIIYFMQLLLFKVVSADEIKQFIKVFNKGHAV